MANSTNNGGQLSNRSLAQRGRPHRPGGQGRLDPSKPRELDGRTREGRARRAAQRGGTADR